MKRPALVFCVLTLLLSLAGCPNPLSTDLDGPEGLGSLVVNVAASGPKALLPSVDLTPASYRIVGHGPGDRNFEYTSLSDEVTIPDLAHGPWTIIAEALNAEGTVVGRGADTVKVNSGKTATVEVRVYPPNGFGSLQLSVSWGAAGAGDLTAGGQLLPAWGAPIALSFTAQGPGTASCSLHDIGAGYYSLTVELRDGDELVLGALEVLCIVKDHTTSGVVDLTGRDPAAGKIVVNLTPLPEDPIEVTLSGQRSLLAVGSRMTVTAGVPPDTGNVASAWYLNGISQASGPCFTVGDGLQPGPHLLEVSVFSTDGQHTGSASHPFQVSAQPLPVEAALEWDPSGDANLAGYRLHYGTASGRYTVVVDAGKKTSCTLTGLTAGTTYYIAATAYNGSGQESAYSNEVVFRAAP